MTKDRKKEVVVDDVDLSTPFHRRWVFRSPAFGSLDWAAKSPVLTEPAMVGAETLKNELRELQSKFEQQALELRQERSNTKAHKAKAAILESTLSEFDKKQGLTFLLDRVSADARNALLSIEALRTEFLAAEPKPLYAVSLDIRRSTDLMLKARSPDRFAEFITTLCAQLMDVVQSHFGVIDKFTGDGILCFFPEFFSGNDAGYHALAAAAECHSVFVTHYRNYRSSFQSVLADVGLGIGVDYGPCNLVQVAGSLTIVGVPVVYACRLGGAPAGTTLLNQPAYEAISSRHGGHVLLTETRVEIKHEGSLVAYRAELSRDGYLPAKPEWTGANQPLGHVST